MCYYIFNVLVEEYKYFSKLVENINVVLSNLIIISRQIMIEFSYTVT